MHGDGERTRDSISVENVTAVLADAVYRGVTCEGPVNLPFDRRRSANAVISELNDVLG